MCANAVRHHTEFHSDVLVACNSILLTAPSLLQRISFFTLQEHWCGLSFNVNHYPITQSPLNLEIFNHRAYLYLFDVGTWENRLPRNQQSQFLFKFWLPLYLFLISGQTSEIQRYVLVPESTPPPFWHFTHASRRGNTNFLIHRPHHPISRDSPTEA